MPHDENRGPGAMGRGTAILRATAYRIVLSASFLAWGTCFVSKPFNPRTEISADAQYIAKRIVKTMWIIFVLIPVVFGIMYGLSTIR
jgi:hypothetical protein